MLDFVSLRNISSLGVHCLAPLCFLVNAKEEEGLNEKERERERIKFVRNSGEVGENKARAHSWVSVRFLSADNFFFYFPRLHFILHPLCT